MTNLCANMWIVSCVVENGTFSLNETIENSGNNDMWSSSYVF